MYVIHTLSEYNNYHIKNILTFYRDRILSVGPNTVRKNEVAKNTTESRT